MARSSLKAAIMACVGYGVFGFSACPAWAQSTDEAARAERLAQIYRDTADMPEFTRQTIRMKALSEYSPVDLTSAGKPNEEFDRKYHKDTANQPAMYPADAVRLAKEAQQGR